MLVRGCRTSLFLQNQETGIAEHSRNDCLKILRNPSITFWDHFLAFFFKIGGQTTMQNIAEPVIEVI